MRQLVVKLLDTRSLVVVVVVSSLEKHLASFLSLCTFLSSLSLESLSFGTYFSSLLSHTHICSETKSVSTSVRLRSVRENARGMRERERIKCLAISRGQSERSSSELVVSFSCFACFSPYECDSE